MKETKKNLKLQYKRLDKVLTELKSLRAAIGDENEAKNPIEDAIASLTVSWLKVEMALSLISSPEGHQDLPVWLHISDRYSGTDIKLLSKVDTIMLPYPFRIDHNGSQNVYKIKPTQSLRKLVEEIKEVVRREYEAGNCDAPHELSDFWIEIITVHRGGSATIYIGS